MLIDDDLPHWTSRNSSSCLLCTYYGSSKPAQPANRENLFKTSKPPTQGIYYDVQNMPSSISVVEAL